MPGDSCTSQLLSIVHEIQSSFDYKPSTDVRAILLDISKTFELKYYGVEGNLFRLLENFLDNRKQRVMLDGQCSS